jgi:acyl transferase domain-containing protein/acyl carrier protein
MSENSTNGASPGSVERSSADREPPNLSTEFLTAEAIQTWLVSRLSELLGIEPREIDVREPFASYGLGSTEMVGLSGELADRLGRQISPALPYEYPTVETLARHLAESADASESGGAESGATVEREEKATGEPIAIIGIGCRFPGADDPQAFWQLLRDGVDAITEVPAERFKLDAFYDPDPAAPGKTNTRWGGFLKQVDQFDPHFFGISPREAARMDPQQRLLLEVAWEALQDAGQVAERLAGTQAGVFIGISNNDYGRIQFGEPHRIDAYAGTGNALSIAANRISYLFDFRGPSMAIDTACSSSLVAVHLACRSLWNGESNLALAGGVNLILSPAITINFTKAGVMAPDGRCKTFDARANGYVRSEGAGIVVLKPLSRALADADPIYAVVRGSAVNQDGRSNGLMAPNPLAQEAVLREAYRRAGVSPGEVQYVEAHGTGTLLGDPIEVKALGAVLGFARSPERPCALGAVKTNIGHLEAAAGIAGLIKVALALKHREIPPNLHFEEPNPHIPFDRLPLRVQTTLGPWPVESGPALAGVSSFGFGGTNAHVVLEEASQSNSGIQSAECTMENPHSEIRNTKSGHLLPLSARSPEALQSLAGAYQDLLASPESELSLHDICYTASMRRDHHDYRLAVTGYSREQLSEGLQAFLHGEARPGLSSGRKDSGRQRKLVFVFPGQGSQWFGMGRSLLEREPVFREVVERCDRAMRRYGDWSLLGELTATDAARSRLNEVDIVQPALFAIQVALTALWRSWGIEPQAVVGHSMGEVAAAHVAGALSLEDAARIICHRSRLVRRAIGQGAMAAVELSMEAARGVLAGYEDRVSIAASNSPTSTVLSGDRVALEAILDQLRRRDIFCAMVKVDFASHSPQMDPLRAELLRALEGLRPQPVSIPIYSTVTGMVSGGLEFEARYWARNLREPVLFSAALQRLLEDGHDIFLEVSPHPILLSGIQQELHHLGHKGAVVASMRRDEEERTVMLGSLCALYTLGYPVDWSLVYPTGGRCVRLPSHRWQRERCWMDSAADETDYLSYARGETRGAEGQHPLLGRHFKSAHLAEHLAEHPAETHFWEVTLDKRALPYLDDHRIEGAAVLPASAYVEMALAAAVEAFGAQSFTLKNIEFHRALFLPDGETRLLQLILAPGTDGAPAFQIYSRPAGIGESGKSWTLHATGGVSPQKDGSVFAAKQETLAEIQARCLEKISGQDYYARLSESGIHYGPFFQSITQLWRHNGDVLGEMRTHQGLEAERSAYRIYPAILDACLQVAGAAVATEATASGKQTIFMPTHMDEIRIHGRPGPHLWSYAHLRERNADTVNIEVRVLDEAGQAAVEIVGLRFESLGGHTQGAIETSREENIRLENISDWLYEFQWQLKQRADEPLGPEPSAQANRGSWLIFADRGGVGEALAALLEAQGARSILVSRGDSYETADSTHFRIRPESPEDLRQLFGAALSANQAACRRIVHLWSLDSLDTSAPQETTAASLVKAQSLGCGAVLPLVQELARQELTRADLRDPPRLWLVTRGAQAAGEELLPLNVAQAPLWGMGRVIAQEHAALWGGLIDLEPGTSPLDAVANRLWEQIFNPDGEDQIAFRQGRRYVGRLVRKRQSVAQRAALAWPTDGSYLITGGLGDLGLVVARWMVEQGARRLILLGRTKFPPRSSWSTAETGSRLAHQVGAIRALEALGASVHLASVDVADEAQLRAFLEEFGAEGWPPIRGVVHAAGVLRDGLLSQLDQAALNTVLRPKMMGGWLLHRLLEDAPLDFFVLFSSAGSLLGQPGQANYAAANAFLDALAHHRKAQGRPALSVNWGAWAELGFAETAGGKRLAARLALVGIRSMAPRQALEVLQRMLRQDAVQVAVVPVDWKQYRQFYSVGSESPLLSQLANEEAELQPQAVHPGEKRKAFLAAEPAARLKLLRSYLSEQVARVLGLSVSRLDVEQPLSNLGLDSLMAVELKNRIAVDLGVNVPMVKFLQGPSVAQAASQILDQLNAELSAPSAPPTSAVAQCQEEYKNGGANGELLAKLDLLSDEEVNSLLTDILDKAEISE